MKKLYALLFSSFLTLVSLQAQTIEFWGMTNEGGNYGTGTIFKTDSNGYNHNLQKSFMRYVGQYPYGSLMQASNGKLYGMTDSDGAANDGVLFEYDPTTSTYEKLIDFDSDNVNLGSNPLGNVIEASNGKLYGMTYGGGANGMGVLFEYDLGTALFSIKVDFDGTNLGSYPYGSLIQASNGKLYGMTTYGGTSDVGVIFEYDLTTDTCTKKFDFDKANSGGSPEGSLVQATNGKLYGMTPQGGASGNGVFFEYNLTTDTYTKVSEFDDITLGQQPWGSLMQASNGKLYGLTYYGGTAGRGVLFEYDTTTETYIKKFDFVETSLGENPYRSLVQASNEKLYGMTPGGGTSGYGVIFEFDLTTDTYSKKIDFDGENKGDSPLGSLVVASDGNLYGMTYEGGVENDGVLFQYNPITLAFSKMFDFGAITEGGFPNGSLMQANNEKLYGLTEYGGVTNDGVLFEYDPILLTYTKILDFDYATLGANPKGSLVQATNEKLYGMTMGGGTSGSGILFEFEIATGVLVKKVDFNNVDYGRNPNGSLIQASNEKLYGMATYGGTSDCGVLFEYDLSTDTFTKKLDFDGSNTGQYPYGSLIEAANGNFYGMTSIGGVSNEGVLFEYNLTTDTYTKKIDFDGSTKGRYPYGSILEAANGKLYGLTSFGGIYDMGVLFEYDLATDTYTKKIDFNGTDLGNQPYYTSLIQGSNEKLYGMTRLGGDYNYGVLFEYDITTEILTKKLDFDGMYMGARPYGSLLEVTTAGLSIDESMLANQTIVYPNPTQGLVNIDLNNLKEVSINVFNICGQLIYHKDVINITSIYQFEFNKEAGIYFIEITSDQGKRTLKLIKE